MKNLEVFFPDASAEEVAKLSGEDYDSFVSKVERLLSLQEKQQEAGLRKFTAKYLLVAGSIILTVSLGLITTQAFGLTKLPDEAITALIGSVAFEFVGMLWMVVRYLFTQGSKDGEES